MSKSELERVKEDIETIKEAVGFELPFGWDSVLVNFLLWPGLGVWFLVYWFLSEEPSRFTMGIPAIVAIMCALGYLRFKYRKSSGRSTFKRQEHNWNLIEMIVAMPILLFYFMWAREAGVNTAFIGGGISIVLGITHTIGALHLKGRLYWLGGGIPVTIFGVALLIWQHPTAVVLYGFIFICAIGLGMGGIQAYQLKRSASKNDTD